MIRMRLPRTWWARALIVVAVLGLPSAAFGYWTGAWTGTTSVKLAQTVPVVLSPGTVSADLSPGDSAAVNVVVSNPNTTAVHIGSFLLDTGDSSAPVTVDGGHSGCDLSALSFTTQTNSGAGWTVPPAVGASDGTLTVGLVDSLAMSETAANACQGAQFTLALDATS
jgi:hypothetical protein